MAMPKLRPPTPKRVVSLTSTTAKAPALTLPTPKRPKLAANPQNEVAKLLQQVTAAGGNDPTKQGPGFLDRIFGPLDTLGTGVRSLVHNVVDTQHQVNPLDEMGKALKGEKRIEGADILGDLGVQNKWGKMLGGMAVDIVTDPITWASFGYGALTKAAAKDALVAGAEHGFDAVKMLQAADTMNDATKADQLRKAASIIENADLGKNATEAMRLLGEGKTVPEIGRALQYDLYHGVLKGAASELGEGGGAKLFGKTILPVQGAMDTAAEAAQKLVADKAPAIGKLFSVTGKTMGAGPVEQLVTKGAMSAKAAYANTADEASRGLRDALYRAFPGGEGDKLLDEALIATEHVMPADKMQAMHDLFGTRNAADEQLGKVGEQIAKLAETGGKNPRAFASEMEKLATKRDLLSEASDVATGQIADLYRQHLDPSLVGEYLKGNGVAPELADRFTAEVLPKYQGVLDSLAQQKRAAGLGENTWLGGVLKEARPDLPLSTGYAPIRPQVLETPEKLSIAQRVLDETKGEPISLLDQTAAVGADNLTHLPAEGPKIANAEDLLQIGSKGASTGARTGKQFMRESPTIEAAITDKGILPELNYAEAMVQKVGGDIKQLGNAQMYDTIAHGLGKQVMGAKTEAEALSRAAEGNDILHLVRHGVDQFWEVPAGAKKAVSTFDKAFSDDESVKAFGKFFDKAQGILKKGMTQWNVGQYNARNHLWNGWMMWAHDLGDPEAYAKGIYWAKNPDAMVSLGKEGEVTAAEAMERALKSGGAEGQFFKAEVGRAATVGERAKNPLNLFDKTAGGIANAVEDGDRLGAWVAAKRKGLSDQAAGNAVKQALYDFSPEVYTAFESKYLARVIPFYRWFRNNTPEMLNVLTHTPGKMTWLPHLQQNAEVANPVDEAVTPDYLKKMFAIPLPIKDDQGNTVIWRPNSPIEDLYKLSGDAKEYLSSITPLFRDPIELLTNNDWYFNDKVSNYPGEVRRAPGYLERFDDLIRVSNVTPIQQLWNRVKEATGIETVTDKKTGSPYLAMNAYAVKAMRDLIPWMNNVGKFVDDQQRSPYDRLTQATGIKLLPFETEKFAEQKAYQDRDALTNEVTRLKAKGEMPKTKPKKPKPLSLTTKKPAKAKKPTISLVKK